MNLVKLVCAFVLGPITCLLLFGFPEGCCGPIKVLLLTALIYPVLEELTFRGFIQTSILSFTTEKVVWELSFANLFTSLIFSSAHLIYMGWDKAILVFLPSLIFGYFRESTSGMAAPIGLHCFYNFNFIVFN